MAVTLIICFLQPCSEVTGDQSNARIVAFLKSTHFCPTNFVQGSDRLKSEEGGGTAKNEQPEIVANDGWL